MIPITKFKFHEFNPRVISDHDLERLKNSIKGFNKMMKLRPMVVEKHRGNYRVLGGNRRLQALIALGYEEIPDEWVIITAGLTPKERKEFMIKDNTHYGEWDWEMIMGSEWMGENLNEWGLEIPKWPEFDQKNRELDPHQYDDQVAIQLKFTFDQHEKVLPALHQIDLDPSKAVWKLLFDNQPMDEHGT